MTKKELASAVAEKLEITKKLANGVIESAFETIAEALANGEEVAVAGFGKFSVTERAAREGHNPSTGEAIHIEATKSPKFKASSLLKQAVK